MVIFLSVVLILLMLMGFLLYTVVAATFFFTVPLVFRELRQRWRRSHPAA